MTTPHLHDWTETTTEDGPRTWACSQCPATATGCATCTRVLETTGRVCEDCVSRARNDLREIRDLYRSLPDIIAAAAGLHAIRYDMRFGAGEPRRASASAILGGDALVMSADGNADKTRLGRSETTIDPVLLDAERHDPPSVRGVLAFWEDTWRQELHQPAAQTSALDDTMDYLLSTVAWAAQHSQTWADYRQDTKAILGRLRFITGESRAPVRSDVPCPYCNERIVQDWTGAGLSEARRCTGCARSWGTEAHFQLAIKHVHRDLPNTNPDALVTLDDIRRLWPDLNRNTLNVWMKRDRDRAAAGTRRQMPERGKDPRGATLYRLGDVAARIQPST